MIQQNTGKCPICLEKIKDDIKITFCNHYYHSKCITEWLDKNSTCPLCRFFLKKNLLSREISTVENWDSVEPVVNERFITRNIFFGLLDHRIPINDIGGVMTDYNTFSTSHSSNAANSFPSV